MRSHTASTSAFVECNFIEITMISPIIASKVGEKANIDGSGFSDPALSTLPLARVPGFHSLIELGGSVSRYAQRLPLTTFEVLCQYHDLARVVSVMRKLPVDGLCHGMRFAPDFHGTP